MSATFPVITAADAGRYIATARLTPNAVALRIRQMLAPSGPHVIRTCMYCGSNYGTTPCEPEMHGKLTHGICDSEACLSRAEREFGVTLQRGESAAPVVGSVADGTGRAASLYPEPKEGSRHALNQHNGAATNTPVAAPHGDVFPADTPRPTPSLLRSSESYADAKDGMAGGGSDFAYGCGVRPEGQRTPDEGALGLQPEQPSLPIHGATPAAA